jgi:hypothetical protein
MPGSSLYISYFSAPNGVTAELTIANVDDSNPIIIPGVFTEFGWIDGDGVAHDYPIYYDLPNDEITANTINLTANCSNGCAIVYGSQECIANFPTPTNTGLPTCFYMRVENVTGTICPGPTSGLRYTDCDFNLDYFCSTTPGDVTYICMISYEDCNPPYAGCGAYDVTNTGYFCTYVDNGVDPAFWQAPIIPTQTVTPTAPEPTVTPTELPEWWATFEISATTSSPSQNLQQIIKMSGVFGGNQTTKVDWGDGNVTTLTSFNNNAWLSHTYVTPGTHVITISARTTSEFGPVVNIGNMTLGRCTADTTNIGKVESLNYFTNSATGTLIGNVGALGTLTQLTFIDSQSGVNQLSGNLSGLYACSSLQEITLGVLGYGTNDNNTISGTIGGLPTSIRRVVIDGNNTIGGDISALTMSQFASASEVGGYLRIGGNNTISGDCSNLPDCQSILIDGNNTIGGNLAVPTGCTELVILGDNQITGPISGLDKTDGAPLVGITIEGNNTISGNFQTVGLTMPTAYLRIVGDNTIGGTLPTIPNTMELFQIFNNGNIDNDGYMTNVLTSGTTIGGNINAFSAKPNLMNLWIGGNNTVSGTLESLANGGNGLLDWIQIVSPNNTVNFAGGNTSGFFTNGPYMSLLVYTENNAAAMNTSQINTLMCATKNWLNGPGDANYQAGSLFAVWGDHAGPDAPVLGNCTNDVLVAYGCNFILNGITPC